MNKRLIYLLYYYLFWFLLFTVTKSVFLIYHLKETSLLPLSEILKLYGHGLKMDLSFSAYVSIIPFLFITLSFLFPFRTFFKKALTGYSLTVIFLMVLLSVIDLELFRAWGFRLDATPLMYLNTPGEMIASAGSAPIFLLLFIFLLLLASFAFLFLKWIDPKFPVFIARNFLLFPLFLVLTASLIIPMRGGLQLAPLNVSDAYFSENMFANQAAINVPWNFFNSISRKTYDKSNPYTFMDDKVARDILKTHFSSHPKDTSNILKVSRPNVILIIWESFTAKATSTLGGRAGVTPVFDSLVNEGVLFSNFYAAADRSDKGLISVLSGHPGLPTQSIIKVPTKSEKLPDLSEHFERVGYETSFYYGGELEFANIKSYLYNGGFDNIVGKEVFSSDDQNSKWGAHDHVVLEKQFQDLATAKQPFLSVIFTLSSHEPFEIPIEPLLEGDGEETQFLNSLFYADQSIGKFIRQLKQQPWYDNTLVVILADHGHRMPNNTKNHEPEKYHIPMLWLGGALAVTDTIISTYSSQTDMAATLLAQVGIPHDEFMWSRNILDKDYKPFAQYVFNNGYGHISPKGALIYDHVSAKYIARDSATTAFDLDFSKAYLQLSYQDYLDK